MSQGVISIPPFQYIHVLDTNTNITRVITGPQRYTFNQSEKIVAGPCDMVVLPPRSYVVVSNPHVREVSPDGTVAPAVDSHGQVKLAHGDLEIRMGVEGQREAVSTGAVATSREADAEAALWQHPFPLYPGEVLAQECQELSIVAKDSAIRLEALRNVTVIVDGKEQLKEAGDEWLFRGPGTYVPRVEVKECGILKALVVKHSQALKLRARRAFVDEQGIQRRAGEEWVYRKPGAYLAAVEEEIVSLVAGAVLTDRTALHIKASRAFTDVYGVQRKAGDEWLITHKQADSHIKDVYEQVVGLVNITTLSKRQFCVVMDPYVNGTQHLGTQELRRGEQSFFLHPGESLRGDKVEDVLVLADDEALLLLANEELVEEEESGAAIMRNPGDRWMVYGPRDYIPPVQVTILERRKAIPLDSNEGIYVRDSRSGQVRAVIGETYMLKPSEELWEKELPQEVEALLKKNSGEGERDPTRVVIYRLSENCAVQVYDYKRRTARVVLGPDMIMLMPDEQFSLIRLHGGKPKRPNVVKALHLQLGPDFMTDVLIVETCDHARLELTLSFNWHFQVDPTSDDNSHIFNVHDFVGDACKSIASRVRGAVASKTFDDFHRHSAQIIRSAVFGMDEFSKIKEFLDFPSNKLRITNVDIQHVEPVDAETRSSLQKSVQMAIEITTKSQEARARHDAFREEEEAKGQLDQQRLKHEAAAEESRKGLLELRAETNAVESSGQAKAEAKARAEAASIEGAAAVEQARLRAEASRIKAAARVAKLQAEQQAEVAFARQMDELEIEKERELAEIEEKKFQSMVQVLGPETIAAIARAGPETQAKLLKGLGLQGFMITDGKSPINLFNTAKGMIGAGGMVQSQS